jgi:hypothetical protein
VAKKGFKKFRYLRQPVRSTESPSAKTGYIDHLKISAMSLFNTGKNKKDKKKSSAPANKSAFMAPKGGAKANTKTSSNAGKHVGGAQRGA